MSCENGGERLQYGRDDNANGILEADEYDGTRYICHGPQGPVGATGATGAAGTTSWTGLTDIPSDILDGDNDTLNALTSCSNSQVAKYQDGNGWVCADDAVLSESVVEDFVRNDAISLAAGSMIGGERIVAKTSCAAGQILVYDNSAGWICGDDQTDGLKVKLPVYTVSTRPTPELGLVIYNSQLKMVEIWDGANWVHIRYRGKDGSSAESAALSASALLSGGISTNGVYWLQPAGAPAAFEAYIDFTTPNGPWVHVGTAVGDTRGLWSVQQTWYSRTVNYGAHTDPTAGSSSFNAGAFIHVKGDEIMLKEGGGNSGAGGSVGYTQCAGLSNESWRDVYAFIGSLSGWPSTPSVHRTLPITARTVGSSSLIYGGNPTQTEVHDSCGVYVFDEGGDTMAMFATAAYQPTHAWTGEADMGIGACEDGPNASTWPNLNQTSGIAYDAGTNNSQATNWANVPFSLWIRD